MELKLKDYGTIEITNATLVDGGDILIEAADGFEKLSDITGNPIEEVFLVQNDFGYDLVAWLNLPDDDWLTQRTFIAEVESTNQDYSLSAFL